MGKKRIRITVAKQLFFYYLCPVILSVIISAVFIIYAGRQFVAYTGIRTRGAFYHPVGFTLPMDPLSSVGIVSLQTEAKAGPHRPSESSSGYCSNGMVRSSPDVKKGIPLWISILGSPE